MRPVFQPICGTALLILLSHTPLAAEPASQTAATETPVSLIHHHKQLDDYIPTQTNQPTVFSLTRKGALSLASLINGGI